MPDTYTLQGTVKDKTGNPIAEAEVRLLDRHFETLYSGLTDANGNYALPVQAGVYPFFFACKDYALNNLEFWCQDLPLWTDLSLDAVIDKLEVYGLHCFSIRGASPALTLYFRPMSLEKVLAKENNLCPDLEAAQIKAWVNGVACPLLHCNRVSEYIKADQAAMDAFLIQIARPDGVALLPDATYYLLLEINDCHSGAVGQAGVYFTY
ncbi:MAG: carboxypeptidase-like regulatory domain-containing protein [Negativicutes bacterium]|nr:carboxypeptidase-like regulatory domain-containing protein [Negativicutes bacterium]